MKAVRVHGLGGPEVLSYEETGDPSLAADEALIRIEAIGVNYLDIYYRSGFHWGGHHQRSLPYIPGAEAAGTVVEVGPEVTGVRIGDRVAYGISNGQGSYAELEAVPVWHLVPVPPAIDFRVAAAAMLQGMTAHYLTHSTYPLGRNDTALVHAAAGGTGMLLVQMAKMQGANVIGTASSPEKREQALRVGADAVVGYEDFTAEVKRFTGGHGVNVVYDSVGKDTFEQSLDCLAPLGFLVIFGQSSGAVPAFDTAILNAKGSLSLCRPSLTHHTRDRAEVLQRGGDVLRWVAEGSLRVGIARTFPLSKAAAAHRALAERKTSGKILLIP